MRSSDPTTVAWSGDDILSTAAETYALLPRPSGATTAAFATLMREYWPGASAGTRLEVGQALRSSRRIARNVLDLLERLEIGETEPVLEAEPSEDDATPPSLVESAAADHARDTLRALARSGERGPELQPREIARRLRDTTTPAHDLADLLRLPEDGAEQVLGDPRGTIVALKALGIATPAARGFVARWQAAVPPGFVEAYEAITLEECLDVVAAWRGAALLRERSEREDLRLSA